MAPSEVIRLTALRPLRGDYGNVGEGQTFETDPATAESLEARGLAERYREPPAVTFAQLGREMLGREHTTFTPPSRPERQRRAKSA